MDDKEKETKRIERLLNYLTNLPDQEYVYTSWEATFIESVDAQFKAKGTLSPKQIEILERIYHHV